MSCPRVRAILFATLCAAPLCIASARRAPKPAADWQTVASPGDRSRLHLWRVAWMEGLRQARASGAADRIAAAGALLDPDAAIPGDGPPDGAYRCRTYKIGAQSVGAPTFTVAPAQPCRIVGGRFAVTGGMQRPAGRLWANDPGRQVFLGAMALGDEPRVLEYGRDTLRDMIGVIEPTGPRRWRLVLPSPRWQSKIDVIEIVPADG